MKHIDKYTIISILSSFLLFSCSEGLEIKSGPMILSVDKDMHMTVELTGNDAPLTEKSQTEYIVFVCKNSRRGIEALPQNGS